ncbi:MAG: ATP-binding protein [Atopobiaceae bacterium]|jgi:PAS domain S-box-containing protein
MKRIEHAKDALVAEGRKVLFAQGYTALDIKGITAACGMATGTFYSYFPGKKEFALAIVANVVAESREEIVRDLESGGSLRDTLSRIAVLFDRYREKVGAVYWQIPLTQEESAAVGDDLLESAKTLARRALGKSTERLRPAPGVSAEDVDAYVAQYLVATGTVGAIPFDDFFSCLTALLVADLPAEPCTSGNDIVYVIDARTRELLFANDDAVAHAPEAGKGYQGRTCFSFFVGRDSPCEGCQMPRIASGTTDEAYGSDPLTGERRHLTGFRTRWSGHDAVVMRVRDAAGGSRAQGGDALTVDFLRRMARMIPGSVAVYLLRGGALETIYTSADLPGILGMNAADYGTATGADAFDIVYPADAPALREALAKCLESSSDIDAFYRVRHVTRGFDWVHAKGTICGRVDGCPALVCSFSNASVETDIYQELLDNTDRSITVIDRATHELLYANGLARRGFAGAFEAGLTCYAAQGQCGPCEPCVLDGVRAGVDLEINRLNARSGHWERITGRRIGWCGHDAFVVFVDDINDLKLIEQEANHQRHMYEAAVENAELVVWEYEAENHRMIMSDNAFTLRDRARYGISKVVEDVPRSIARLIADEDVESYYEMFRKIDEGADLASCTVWYKHLPGMEPRCMSITLRNEFDSDGRPTRAYGVGQNVTARETMRRRYELAFDELSRAYPHSIASFHLNLTKNLVGGGKSKIPSVLKQQESGTADGYFAAFAKLLTDEPTKRWFLENFDRERLLKRFEEGQTQISFEYPIIYDDGTRHWREGLLVLARNPETGDVEGVTYALDIDESKNAELMIRVLSREVFGFVILLDMRTGMIVSGGDTQGGGKEHYENEDYTTAMVEALRRMMPPEILDQSIRAHSIESIRNRLAHHRSFDLSFQTREGRYLHWRIAYADRKNEIVLIMREDITEVANEEQARIRELEGERRARQHAVALLQSILDTAPTAMFWKDRNRRFEGANKAFLDFYEFGSLDDILGKNDEDMGWHPNPGPFKSDEERVIEEGMSTHRVPGECMSRGRLCHIVASKSPRYENGEIVGLVGNFEDVTSEFEHAAEVEKLNSELKGALDEAERANAAEQAFLSSMSHDMRTPLNGIIGFTDLARRTDDIARKQEYLDKIDVSGRLMLDLVNDVLDLSKIESGKMELRPEPFSGRELFDAIVDSLRLSAEKRGITLTVELDETYPRFINADRLRVQQIALNLLSNAIKYTPDGGAVRFEVRRLEARDDGMNTLLEVSDNGIGMSEMFQRRMFEPFSQEHQSRMYGTQGTGLGLSIVRSIVDLMSGRIECDSELGRGTTFDVYLPIEPADVGRPDNGASYAGASGAISGMHILLCEDNQLNAEIAETILRERGEAVVDHARDGEEGLRMFVGSRPGAYDAVLMDLRMPVMDGLEATRAIRALDRPDAKTVPIVAMTADAFAEDVERCLDAGMNDHVAKPIDPGRLFAVLGALAGTRGR